MSPLEPSPVLDKKRTVVLLRSVVIVSVCYLIVFGEAPATEGGIAYILALIVSNAALVATPPQWFRSPRFSAALLLGDTLVVLVGLYFTVGCFSQDFLIIYFFTIFLTTATASLVQIALGAALISILYGYWLALTTTHALGSAEWLRLPFFFIVAVFYAYMTEETKHERYRREAAEREAERLRSLLQLDRTFDDDVALGEWGPEVAGMVESAFPRLACRVAAPADPAGAAGTALPIESHDQRFGNLCVTPRDGVGLSPHEEQFCRVLATASGAALRAADQVRSAHADSTRLKQEFLWAVSHELRSPLHLIVGNADVASEILPPDNGEMRSCIGHIQAGARRLRELVDQLLCFAELRAGRATLFRERVPLGPFFEELRAWLREQLEGRDVAVECHVAAGLSSLQTDRQKLRLILEALLSNAAKFTAKGFIRLDARGSASGWVEISVRDSGIGIAAEDFNKVFEDFRQLDGSLTRQSKGLGLGLALAHELVEVLGGELVLDSQPQRGSVFVVRLPPQEDVLPEPAGAPVAALKTEY